MSGGKFNYRVAEEQDIGAMYDIEIMASRIWKKDYFVNELSNSFSLSAVALDNDRIIGFAVAWNVMEEVQLNNIGVHPDYRRQGIASGLIDFVIQSFESSHPEKVLIEVKSSNSEALSFYRHLGFYRTGIRKKYYGDDDAILMEKIITSKESL